MNSLRFGISPLMLVLRLNRLALNYGRTISSIPSRRCFFNHRSNHFPACGYSLKWLSPLVFQGGVIRSPFKGFTCSFDLHTCLILNNIESVPNKSSQPNVLFPPNPDLLTLNSSNRPPTAPSAESNSSSVSSPTENNSQKAVEPKKPKKSLWTKFKEELIHYYHGFRLLGLETRIAGGICFRLLTGKTLTRRERNQLVRTVADIIRLVPFAVFIIVPFMELLLPVYLKFFPFMLPSTFKEKSREEDKVRQTLKAKLEIARFLQDTVMRTTSSSSKPKDVPTINEFQEFLKTVRQSGQLANTSDIVKFSRLFEDQITLDSLDHAHLKALCQLLEINSIGPSNLLRFQLWLRVRQLRTEDKLIAKEGVDQLPSWELQSLSRSRGMRSLGLTEERLRSQLSQWLELHLEKNVPIALLLLSRAMYLQDTTLPPEQQLQHVISRLPDSATEEAVVKAAESSEDVDFKTKMEILRKEQKTIKAERAAARKAAEENEKMESHLDAKADIRKAAEVGSLESKFSEDLLDTAKKLVGKTTREPLEPIAPPTESAPMSSVATPSSAAENASTVSPINIKAMGTPEETLKIESFEVNVAKASRTDEEPLVSSKDIDNIKDAIENIEESKKALQDEQLFDLKADLEEAVKLHRQLQKEVEVEKASFVLGSTIKLETISKEEEKVVDKVASKMTPPPSYPPEPVPAFEKKPEEVIAMVETKNEDVVSAPSKEESELAAKASVMEELAMKKAVKTEKAVKRLGAQVDRLLGEIDSLMDTMSGKKQELLNEIRTHEDQIGAYEDMAAKDVDGEKREKLFEHIRSDQQRVVDINDVLASLQQLQKAAGSDAEAVQRWQCILDALDEDHDGKIEFKHLLAVLELFEKEKVKLKTSQLSDVVEMFEKEDQLEEEEDQVEETTEVKKEYSSETTKTIEDNAASHVDETASAKTDGP